MRPPSSISDRSFPSSALSPSGNHLCNLFFIFNHFQFPVVTKQAEVIDRRVPCRHTCYTRLPCFAKCIRGKNWPNRECLFFPFGLLLALYEFLNFELLGNLPEIGTPGVFWEDCEYKVVMLTFISHPRKLGCWMVGFVSRVFRPPFKLPQATGRLWTPFPSAWHKSTNVIAPKKWGWFIKSGAAAYFVGLRICLEEVNSVLKVTHSTGVKMFCWDCFSSRYSQVK